MLRNNYQAKLMRMKQRLQKRAGQQSVMKIIVGASGIQFEDWFPTNKEILNLLFESDWAAYLELGSVDTILAEHVWEHLTPEEAITSAHNCFRFLKPGGYLRAAVPDGFHPDLDYIEWVKPGGVGPGSNHHKVLYNHATFCKVFKSAGFNVSLYEYFDAFGKFHAQPWNPVDGMIQRSDRYDRQFFDRSQSGGNFHFTSLIIDAKKPDLKH